MAVGRETPSEPGSLCSYDAHQARDRRVRRRRHPHHPRHPVAVPRARPRAVEGGHRPGPPAMGPGQRGCRPARPGRREGRRAGPAAHRRRRGCAGPPRPAARVDHRRTLAADRHAGPPPLAPGRGPPHRAGAVEDVETGPRSVRPSPARSARAPRSPLADGRRRRPWRTPRRHRGGCRRATTRGRTAATRRPRWRGWHRR